MDKIAKHEKKLLKLETKKTLSSSVVHCNFFFIFRVQLSFLYFLFFHFIELKFNLIRFTNQQPRSITK